MPPLPLDSPRWKTLKAHFSNAAEGGEQVPSVISLLARWKESLGTYGEELIYDPLHESFLHQGTIRDVAYAVVPHVAAGLDSLHRDRRIEVLQDIADVELIRRRPREEVEQDLEKLEGAEWEPEFKRNLMQAIRDRNAPLPDDLAPAYLEALALAQATAAALLAKVTDERNFGELLKTLSALHGQRRLGRLLGSLKEPDQLLELAKELPPGKVSPSGWRRHVELLRQLGWTDDDIRFGAALLNHEDETNGPLKYDDRAVSLEALRAPLGAPHGWKERTGLNGPRGEWANAALRKLAWLEGPYVTLEMMLAK